MKGLWGTSGVLILTVFRCFSGVSGVSGVFAAVFRLFYRDPLGTLFGCFSAVD